MGYGPQGDDMLYDIDWMKQCLPSSFEAKDNFFRHTQWRMLVIGEKHSGMFMHPDGINTATFHVGLHGRKR